MDQPNTTINIPVMLIAYVFVLIFMLVYYAVSVIGNESLSDYERDNAEEIIMEFHTDPDYGDFIYINSIKSKLPNTRSLKYWFYGVYKSQPHFFEYAEINGVRVKPSARDIRDIERGLRKVRTSPTGELLDCVWAVYFATGDTTYSNIIRDVALSDASIEVKASASWSYKSIMGVRPELAV